jgi:hypothetical protein
MPCEQGSFSLDRYQFSFDASGAQCCIHGSLSFFYKAYVDRKYESDMIVKCWCQRQYVYILFFGHQ